MAPKAPTTTSGSPGAWSSTRDVDYSVKVQVVGAARLDDILHSVYVCEAYSNMAKDAQEVAVR